jgi:hypothetical protein
MAKRLFALVMVCAVAWLSLLIYGEKVADLPEIMKPRGMDVDDARFYVTEDATVFIYSLKDFKLLKKFGSKGQGPQEFQVLPHVPVSVDVSTDKLIVFSIRKISYFTKEGEFIREVRALGLALRLIRFGDYFLGWSQTRDEGIIYSTVNIFDKNLTKIKEVYRVKDSYQGPGRGYHALPTVFTYQTYENKILVPGQDDATVDVFEFNSDLKKLFSIRVDQKPIKIGQEFKDQLTQYYKTAPETREIYETMLKPLFFPDHLPVILDFFVDSADNGTIYIITWKKEAGKNDFYTYDMTGKFKKQVTIPLKYQNAFSTYPALIKNGKLYQLVEDEKREVWELYITEIK